MADDQIADIPILQSDDFETRYANHVNYEATVFDMTTVFGEYVNPRGKEAAHLIQHTAITMAWAEAKLAAIFLMLQIAFQEEKNGAIKIPDSVRPKFLKPEQGTLSLEQILKAIIDRDLAIGLAPKEGKTESGQ